MLNRKLLRTAWNYKAQFLSMILMIAIGIGVFVGFNMEWYSIEADTSDFFESTHYADYRIYSDKGFTSEDLTAVENIEGVRVATRYLSVNVGIRDTAQTVTLNVHENNTVSTLLVTAGAEYDENSDGIWLSDRFAEANGISIGDSLCFVYQGLEIDGKVVGLCKSGENMICVADGNQLMPDYTTHGFAYISPKKLEKAMGVPFYPQINLCSDLPKAELEQAVNKVAGTTWQVTEKDLHTAYAGAKSEAEEGKTMGSVLPVLFLVIAILTMVTTMHRIAVNEKVQIGTLKALGFLDRQILWHYTSYGLFIGAVGSLLGVAIGYGIAGAIISPSGMMSTYFDLPEWKRVLPPFCLPVVVLTTAFLALISFLSTQKMLAGTAADALRPYTPKGVRKSLLEKLPFTGRWSFSAKWNLRDILRHKARSAMTLLGVLGCTVLIVGGLGMKDTMENFLSLLDNEVSCYAAKVNLSETATREEARELTRELDGTWQATVGISYRGDTTSLEIYSDQNKQIHFLGEDNRPFEPESGGVYLCLRLKDTAKIGETVEISPYGSEETYRVKVLGYDRSLVSKSLMMTESTANDLGMNYHIGTVYTNRQAQEIPTSSAVSGKQSKTAVMDSYDTFLDLMNLMVAILIGAAVVLGVVVLYNLGVMSYMERKREFATLSVLGFRDRAIGKLLIDQNTWLTLIGVLLGLPGGYWTLRVLVATLASEYELNVTLRLASYAIATLLTLVVSLLVSVAVAGKTRKIDRVEALKGAE